MTSRNIVQDRRRGVRLRHLAILLVLLALIGCAPAAQPAPQPADAGSASEPAIGGTVTRALTTEPPTLDPHGPPGSGQNVLLPYLFDTLVFRDEDNNYHPFLAKDWEIAPDGKTITFELRDDVAFHDGTPLDAEAVAFTFERFKEKGARNPLAGGVLSISEIEVIDEYTVSFHFDQPSSIFFSTISMPYAGILSPTAVEAYGEDIGQHPVGTGPFKMASWDAGVSITLARNPDYAWGPPAVENKGAPHIEQAVFKVIPDASTQLAALQAGEIDVMFVNNPSHLRKLRQDGNTETHEATINSLIYLGFNCQRPPFDNVQVRQALAHAVNKEEVLEIALGGLGQVAHAPLAETLPGYDPVLKQYELGYNPARAEDLLVEAGFTRDANGVWVRGDTRLEATILTSTRAPNGAIATVLQSQFKAIGVPVEIQQLDARAVLQAGTQGDYDLMVWRYGWNDADVLNIYLSSDRIGSTNRFFYSNEQVDTLFEEAMHTLDEDKREQLYIDVQKIILQEAPWQPLYMPVDVLAFNKRVDDIVVGAMGRVLLNDARVVQR